MLATLPLQLRALLETNEPSLRRLFPVAYHQDPEHEAEFQRLMRDDILQRRIGAAEMLAESANSKTLAGDDQINGWLGAINDLRLVLGTQLDVSEDSPDFDELDDDDPRVAQFHVYSWLGYLMEMLIQASMSPEERGLPSFFDFLDGVEHGADGDEHGADGADEFPTDPPAS